MISKINMNTLRRCLNINKLLSFFLLLCITVNSKINEINFVFYFFSQKIAFSLFKKKEINKKKKLIIDCFILQQNQFNIWAHLGYLKDRTFNTSNVLMCNDASWTYSRSWNVWGKHLESYPHLDQWKIWAQMTLIRRGILHPLWFSCIIKHPCGILVTYISKTFMHKSRLIFFFT